MAAVGKITLDARNYEAMLEKIRTLTAKKTAQASAAAAKAAENAQKAASAAAGKVGSNVSAAGGALSAFGSAAGQHMGAAGKAISALAAGPVAALVGAIGTLATVGVAVWDRLTLSAEEYAAKIARIAAEADKDKQKLVSQQADDQGYMARLQELAGRENLSNAAKKEAATLIRMLSSRYGELGIEIDKTTGKIIGADKAQQKFFEAQRRQRMGVVARQLESHDRKSVKQAEMAVNGMFIGEEFMQSLGFGWSAAKDARNAVKNTMETKPLEQRLEMAEKLRDASKRKEDVDAWQAVVDSLEKQVELAAELNMLRETGKSTEKEYAQELKKQTDLSDKKAEAVKASLLGEERLKMAQKKEARSLYEQALRAQGRGKEADEQAALDRARETKGSDLTDKEKAATLQLLTLSGQLKELQGGKMQGDFAVRTNALTARGGFASGVRGGDADKYNRQIASSVQRQSETAQRIESILKEVLQ